MAKDKESPDDILAYAKKIFERAEQAEKSNREVGLADLRFARLGEQWPDEIRSKREADGRPCLTINKLTSFTRQIVNDSRMNKPSIKVNPVDSNADIRTAKVLGDLIRNIEVTSNADIAYDTAVESAVNSGIGFFRVTADYAHADSFDMELMIERVPNAFAVYGDPDAASADGSDWNHAFVVEWLSRDEFERRWKGKAQRDWEHASWGEIKAPWRTETQVLVAEYWCRKEVDRRIFELINPRAGTSVIVSDVQIQGEPDIMLAIETGAVQIAQEKTVKDFEVRQYFMTGAEILEEKEWPGRYIPIVPVYGDEFNVAGERYYRSLVHPAVDAQRMFNYWRTTATELVALAPRVPYIGRKGAFEHDANKWNTANTENHAFLEYDGPEAPQRQPLDGGIAAGALQEALNASDDMKAILGIYDASLGARSNETSGRAIMARQQEGDVSTFHFIDNLNRAIRHGGKILVDLIPHFYSKRKMLKVIGEDGTQDDVPLGAPHEIEEPDGTIVKAIHDLSVGKYDVSITAGPSFTSRRAEAAFAMTEFVRAVPAAGPLMLDKLAKAQDWPDADEIAERAKALMPGKEQQLPPQVQQALAEGAMAAQELEAVKADRSIEQQKLAIERYRAQTERMKVEQEAALKDDDILIKATQADAAIAKMAREQKPSSTS